MNKFFLIEKEIILFAHSCLGDAFIARFPDTKEGRESANRKMTEMETNYQKNETSKPKKKK